MRLHRVTLAESGGSCTCSEDETLLAALRREGRRDVTDGCRGGGCGVCKVRVVAGRFATAPMSRAHVSPAEETAGSVLACRVYPRSDVTVVSTTYGRSSPWR